MSNSNVLQYLNQIATYFKIHGCKLSLDASSMPTCTYKSKTTTGVLNITLMFMTVAKANLYTQTALEKAKIFEWIEYVLLYCTAAAIQNAIKELNEIFAQRTYLVNDRLTIADIFLYLAIHSTMENFSYLDKEKHVHLCRWFDNMQQDKQLLQKNKPIDFTTNYLVSVAPARH